VANIGFVTHTQRPAAHELAAHASAWLAERGHGTRLLDDEAPATDLGDLDLAVSLGGDGTMLRTVAMVCPVGVPILGVNLGRLGYLTTVEPDGLDEALRKFIAGDYQVATVPTRSRCAAPSTTSSCNAPAAATPCGWRSRSTARTFSPSPPTR
jgi:NAD kinase